MFDTVTLVIWIDALSNGSCFSVHRYILLLFDYLDRFSTPLHQLVSILLACKVYIQVVKYSVCFRPYCGCVYIVQCEFIYMFNANDNVFLSEL